MRNIKYRLSTGDQNVGSATLALRTLGKLVNLSGPQFLHLKSRGYNLHHWVTINLR